MRGLLRQTLSFSCHLISVKSKAFFCTILTFIQSNIANIILSKLGFLAIAKQHIVSQDLFECHNVRNYSRHDVRKGLRD